MSFTVSYGCWLSLTVFIGAMEFLHAPHSLFQFLEVACLSLSNMVPGFLSLSPQSHGVAACLSLSLLLAGCLSLSQPVPWNCCMSLTDSHGCQLSLNDSPVLWSWYTSPTVSKYCQLFITVFSSATDLLQVSHCLPWLLTVSHCFYGPMELLHVSHCLPWLLDVSLWSHGVSACLSMSHIVSI